ncbi:gamma-glutamylcyclotransferase [Wenxinia saemankumensis]|uniref:ADP-ribose pyrophosphatase n=1 Tax=Wenxinia saemankumensis TaxID=1447782 RepID=A0A1M6AU72_9RHOB|nr:gamma-glutamylcyclotransferase [Wenxinia saemankumensis]SHI40074.1 nudix-type nucleoside diphosphatase, YffH/AdpP family [Wenxinia saemankumensis]
MLLFLYGTLRDPVLRARVAGRPLDGRAAILPGHEVRTGAEHLPLLAEGGSGVEGLLVEAGGEVLARLDAYEVPFGYVRAERPARVDGEVVSAQVYLPPAPPPDDAPPWDLATWEAADGPLSREAAKEFDISVCAMPAEALARNWHMVRARAAARLAASAEAAPAELRTDPAPDAVVPGGPPELAGGFFRLARLDLRHRTFSGGTSPVLSREVLVGVDAALVLPWDPATDRVLLIEQMRVGPFLRGASNPWTLEPVAGIVDAGESVEAAALRETAEEAGLTGIRLTRMFAFYPSPGSSTDYFHAFAATADLSAHDGHLGGLDSEAEDLRAHVIPLARALDLVDTGEISAGPLIAMLLWLERNRHRLRAAPAGS